MSITCIGSEVLVPSISGANTFFRFCFDACVLFDGKLEKYAAAAVDRSPSAGSKCANGAACALLLDFSEEWRTFLIFTKLLLIRSYFFPSHHQSCYYFEWIVLSVPLITTPYPLSLRCSINCYWQFDNDFASKTTKKSLTFKDSNLFQKDAQRLLICDKLCCHRYLHQMLFKIVFDRKIENCVVVMSS